MRNSLVRRTIFFIRDILLPKRVGEDCWVYIGDHIVSGKPFMAAKLGAVEIKAILYAKKPLISWAIKKHVYVNMSRNAGFFPVSDANLCKFADIMLNDLDMIDVLFSWRPEELFFKKKLNHSYKASFSDTNPHFESDSFWTKYLSGKKVLVIHPLASTIEKQYRDNRTKLFPRPDFIPLFESFTTIKAVQTIAGNKSEFDSWFDALEYMKQEVDKVDFDIALIGCGAYGLPLAAYIKRKGKQAIHLGGVLQLYFGIKGKRWDDWGIYNEYWVSPDKKDVPHGANEVEGGCYW